jgi:hypothetical protein
MTSLVLSSACVVLSGFDTRNVDRTLPLDAMGSVTLETHNGSIEVRTWDRAEIEIHARIEAGGTSAEDVRRFNDTNVEITGSSDSVRIKSLYPEAIWSWFGNSPSIAYTITAPRTARWTVRGHNVRAEIHDVSAAVNVQTHNGSVRVVNLGGPLDVTSHNGPINADFATFQGATIATHNGSVELALPSASRFDLHTNSYRMQFQSDFPLLARTLGGHLGNVDGTVNGGGPGLRFSSHAGHLRLLTK